MMKARLVIILTILAGITYYGLQAVSAQTGHTFAKIATQGGMITDNPAILTQQGMMCLQQYDYRAAYEAFSEAAVQGYGEAQLHLGIMFYNGEGVPRDIKEAYAWYVLAARSGNQPAARYAQEVAGMLNQQDRSLAEQRLQKLSAMIATRRGQITDQQPPSYPPGKNQQSGPGAVTDAQRQPLPPGYRMVDPQGRVLVTQKSVYSARAFLAVVVSELLPFFDQRLRPIGALSDQQDTDAQLAFMGGCQGIPVRGVAFVQVQQGSMGHATIIFDQVDHFTMSFPALCQTYLASNSALKNAPSSSQMQWQQVPYGLGSLRLPQGWRIASTNTQGAVDAAGPDGSGVSLGIYYPVFTSARGPYTLTAPYLDAVSAFKELTSQIAAQSQASLHDLRVIEAVDAGWYSPIPGGQGAMIHWESAATVGEAQRRFQGLSLVSTGVIDYSQWMYYFSTVQAPADRFGQMLPTLIEIWSSWKISDAVFSQRLLDALQSLRTAHQLYREAAEYRSRTGSNVNAAWAHVVRGTWTLEDTATGRRGDVSHFKIRKVIDELNTAAGYERFREVPLAELTR